MQKEPPKQETHKEQTTPKQKKDQFINLFKHRANPLFYNSANNYTENKSILKLA